jgi:hypothetical protein
MSDERKTLEQRSQMSDLERLRHSAAHVLATAILKIWPNAQFAAGPPVEEFLLRFYSHRKAAAGLIFAARYAGTRVARRATTRKESNTTP